MLISNNFTQKLKLWNITCVSLVLIYVIKYKQISRGFFIPYINYLNIQVKYNY